MVERHLAYNHSFQVFIISPEELPIWAKQINNTFSIKASLVPNDPADFSRNSYGQKTLNTLLKELRHNRIDILRLVNLEKGVNMWELLHFMNYDNILLNVQQLHVAMYIGELILFSSFCRFCSYTIYILIASVQNQKKKMITGYPIVFKPIIFKVFPSNRCVNVVHFIVILNDSS